jgi:glycine cleavage system H lipoate-binding protein
MTNWMFRMEYDEPDEVEMLLEATRYGRYVDSL